MKLWIVCVLLLILPAATAQDGHISLLAVSDYGDRKVGTTADLFLRVEPGNGQVFIESNPITRLDTQISTRYANEVVCRQLNLDCKKYNFFYTIQADSSIIGGPSAGAAVGVLTYSVLEGVPVNSGVTISGTMNSGGLIGPVGGLVDKVKVAQDVGATMVLIPTGERYVSADNQTLDLVKEGEDYNVEVIEVADIWEAISFATGTTLQRELRNITIDERYEEVMSSLAVLLCDNAETLRGNIRGKSGERFEQGDNLLDDGKNAFENRALYSSASFCFGAGIQYRAVILNEEELNDDEISEYIVNTERDISVFESKLDEPRTVGDMYINAVVLERLEEAYDRLNASRNTLDADQNESVYQLAYAMERFGSAKAWSQFFNQDNEPVSLMQIEAACREKIEEAEERYDYIELFVNNADTIVDDIDGAYAAFSRGDFSLCILRAAKAKAEANTMLGVFGVRTDQVSKVIDRKLEVIQDAIVRQTERGRFPVVGYSYYEYSRSLQDSDAFSSLLYAEYALELSNEEGEPVVVRQEQDVPVVLLAVGVLVALIVMGILLSQSHHKIRSFRDVRHAQLNQAAKAPRKSVRRKKTVRKRALPKSRKTLAQNRSSALGKKR